MKPAQVKAIGAFLRSKREALGLSMRDLEAISGVGNSVIARFETGQFGRLDPDKLARLSRALGVPLNDVLAAGGITSGADLPRYGVYLRTRYQEIPEEEIAKIERYFARIAHRYGIDEDGPVSREDEQYEPKKRRS